MSLICILCIVKMSLICIFCIVKLSFNETVGPTEKLYFCTLYMFKLLFHTNVIMHTFGNCRMFCLCGSDVCWAENKVWNLKFGGLVMTLGDHTTIGGSVLGWVARWVARPTSNNAKLTSNNARPHQASKQEKKSFKCSFIIHACSICVMICIKLGTTSLCSDLC